MTIGISKERLIELSKLYAYIHAHVLLDIAENACVELNPWMPIESAPKEGTSLVYMPEEKMKIQVAKYHPNANVISASFAFDLTKPTHWQELPENPKGE